MGNFISVVISWVVYTTTLIILLMTGLTMYQAQSIPTYREMTNRMITTTGKLDDSTIQYIEKKSKNRIVITRVNENGQDYGKNSDSTISPYGTRIDYIMTVKAFGYGNLARVKQYNAGHFYAVSQINERNTQSYQNDSNNNIRVITKFGVIQPRVNDKSSTASHLSSDLLRQYNDFDYADWKIDYDEFNYLSLVDINNLSLFKNETQADNRKVTKIDVQSFKFDKIVGINTEAINLNYDYDYQNDGSDIANTLDMLSNEIATDNTNSNSSTMNFIGSVTYQLTLDDGTIITETQPLNLDVYSKVLNR